MNNMPQITIGYALLLIIEGVGGYFYFNRIHITILIPAFFGVVVLVAGIIARKENLRKHAMHFAAMLGLLGIFATAKGFLQLPTLMSGGEVMMPNMVIMQSGMFILSLVFVILCVMSFICARRNRNKVA